VWAILADPAQRPPVMSHGQVVERMDVKVASRSHPLPIPHSKAKDLRLPKPKVAGSRPVVRFHMDTLETLGVALTAQYEARGLALTCFAKACIAFASLR
jgi:hypothetical protein